MAHIVLTDVSVVLAGVDLSDHLTSITLDYSADAVEDTNMGDTTHQRIGGLKDWSVALDFSQDYAAGEVDATLFSAVGTLITFVGKPTSASVGAANPSYSGTALLESYPPISGAIGEKATVSVSLSAAGALTRATS